MAVRSRLSDLQGGAREAATRATQAVLRPSRLEEAANAATRVGQVVALLFVPIWVIVSLSLITAANNVLADIFGVTDYGAGQNEIVGFLVTGITLGALMLAMWSWFQWVRTAGFGFFKG